MTFIALGILEKDGKVLVCRRNRTLPYGNLWEFPTTVVELGETIEDSLERWMFEATGLLCSCEKMLPAFNISDFRVFPVKMNRKNEEISLMYYNACKSLKSNELNGLRMSFPSVIFIKKNRKLGIFHLG